MKKTILSIALLLSVVFVTANNETRITDNNNYSILETTNVNSFCKLVQLGDYDAVKSLIDQGEDVNQRSTGLTPLMFAARHNRSEIAQLLIDNGANLKSKSKNGSMTALDFAERSKANDAMVVIQNAIDTQKKDKKKKK